MRDPNSLSAWLAAHGRVAHTSVARSAGFSAYDISSAVATRQVERVRRSWLVTADCDDWRRAAASVGGRLTCLSAAQERGLWTPPHEGIHIAVASSASRLRSDGMLLHRAIAPVPVARTMVVEPILNVLFHIARCVPESEALTVWESALARHLVDANVLERVQWHSTRAARLASAASSLSDSGTETQFRTLMAAVGVEVRQQVWIDGHPLDGLIGDRLAIQIDGFAHHSQASDRRRDIRADARLAIRGFTVVRFDYQQVFFDPQHVIDTVLTAIAEGLHRVGPRR